MSNIQQRVIALYIHPDQGPILPMELDLMAIEIIALKALDDEQRDDIRMREIAKSIRMKFPGVQPERNRTELASLIGRLSHYTRFNGVVLRLPGVINEDARQTGSHADTTGAITQQLEQINKRVEQLNRDLRTEREEHADANVQLTTLKSKYRQLRTLYEKVNTQFADVQVSEQQAVQDVGYWRKHAEHINAELIHAQQEAGTYQAQLELAAQEVQTITSAFQQQQQAQVDREQELSSLRQNTRRVESAVKNLEETLRKKEQEIAYLRRQLDGDDPLPSVNLPFANL